MACFCYGASVVITPFNVAALATAAVLLEMAPADGSDGGSDLRLMTDTFFRQYVSVNGEYIAILFRSCLEVLPEGETEAFLVSKCLEAWGSMVDGEGHGDSIREGLCSWLDNVVRVKVEDFCLMVGSLQSRLTSHDVLYRMVDIYLKVKNVP